MHGKQLTRVCYGYKEYQSTPTYSKHAKEVSCLRMKQWKTFYVPNLIVHGQVGPSRANT